MTKIYKINGKEIPEVPNIDENSKYLNLLLEALSDKEEECNCPDENGLWCGRHSVLYENPKQSISLKEEVVNIICQDIKYSVAQMANKILSLIQSHLLKEVEQVEPTQYVKKDSELNQTYTQAKLDIIKIINNI